MQLVDSDTGLCFRRREFWPSCDGSRMTGAIAAALRRHLDPGAGFNDADVGAAVDLLVQKGLVTAETAPSGTGPDASSAGPFGRCNVAETPGAEASATASLRKM